MDFSKKDAKNITILVGLSSVIAFTFITVVLAIVRGGAQIYFYEPNTTILIAEVYAGMFGILCCLYLIHSIVTGKLSM